MEIYHLHFAPLEETEPSIFETHGEVSSHYIWIATDTFYPLRFETLFTRTNGSEDTVFAEIRTIRDVSGINEPVEIVPPV